MFEEVEDGGSWGRCWDCVLSKLFSMLLRLNWFGADCCCWARFIFSWGVIER